MRLRILDAPAKPAGIPAYFETVHGALRSGIREALGRCNGREAACAHRLAASDRLRTHAATSTSARSRSASGQNSSNGLSS
jgi:hypothetical protein